MRSFKKGIMETTVVTLICFIGTGMYNMYKIYRDDGMLKNMEQQVQVLQDKYCNINNPNIEQQRMCIEVLKLTSKRK